MSPSHVTHERLEAVSALREAGPAAPTLCEGWTTRDLAAHLVVRERRPDSSLGLVVPPMHRWSERVRASYASQDYESLLERIARGPATVSPWRWPGVENAVNLLEYFVHTEDVRRARPGWSPRALDPELTEALWRQFARTARLSLRAEPGTTELSTPDGAHRLRVGSGEPHSTLTGEVGELILYAFGRREHAVLV